MDIPIEQSRKAIKKTLIYSDIFDFPLTFDELYTFLIAEKKISKDTLRQQLNKVKGVMNKDGYYVLQGREDIITKRKEKEQFFSIKRKRAIKIATVLSYIPTILFIGISGGVAVRNAEKQDDIDLFIITKGNTVWVSRFLITIILGGLGMLRTRRSKNLTDKFCVNMLIDEQVLSFPKEKQDIYMAHEIVQLLPLVERNNTYKIFREKNNWTDMFLPHTQIRKKTIHTASRIPFVHSLLNMFLSLRLVEQAAAYIQKKRMQHHITNEVVTSHILAFHPYDYHKKTLILYNNRIKNEKI